MMIVKFFKINLSKNKNSQFMNNQIGIVNNIFNCPDMFLSKEIDLSLRNSGRFNELFETKRIINTPLTRHELENEKFERIIRLSQLYNYSPTLRIYGCFTSISSIRQKTETSDLAQLELLEKNNILKFIECNFEIKIIVTLDANMIFSNNIYNAEQYDERCNDFINTIKRYKDYKNLKIVIDNQNSLETMFIFDTILICYLPIILFDNQNITYGQAIFDSNINNLLNKIDVFDKRFALLEKQNNDMRGFMDFQNQEKFFSYIMDQRKNNYFKGNEMFI